MNVGVPLVGELDLLGPGRSDLGFPLELVEETGRALSGLRPVDAKRASIFAGESSADAQGRAVVLGLLLAVYMRRILLERLVVVVVWA